MNSPMLFISWCIVHNGWIAFFVYFIILFIYSLSLYVFPGLWVRSQPPLGVGDVELIIE